MVLGVPSAEERVPFGRLEAGPAVRGQGEVGRAVWADEAVVWAEVDEFGGALDGRAAEAAGDQEETRALYNKEYGCSLISITCFFNQNLKSTFL